MNKKMEWQLVIKQPQQQKLEHLATATLADWLASQAEHWASEVPRRHQRHSTSPEIWLAFKIGAIRNYFSNLPKKFHDKLLTEAKRALIELKNKMPVESTTKSSSIRLSKDSGYSNLGLYVISRIIETLFTKNITCLELSSDDTTMFHLSFCRSHLLTGVTNLTLFYNEFDVDINQNIVQLLKKLHSLKYLKLSISAGINREMLKCIAENCKLIAELDFTSSEVVDENAHDLINQLPNLKMIRLNVTQTKHFCKQLILNCNHVEQVFVPESANFTLCKFVEEIAMRKEHARKLIKLISYTSVSDTKEQMKLVVKNCPLIQKITLYNFRRLRTNLKALGGLKKLSKLNLIAYNFYKDNIKEVLDEIGSNIKELSLMQDALLDFNALVHISQTCPNLESLIISNCVFVKYKPQYKLKKLKTPPFRNLKRLYLVRDFSVTQKAEFINEVVLFLLSNCVNVEYVNIGYPDLEYTSTFLEENPLMHLQELKIAPRKMATYEILWKNNFFGD